MIDVGFAEMNGEQKEIVLLRRFVRNAEERERKSARQKGEQASLPYKSLVCCDGRQHRKRKKETKGVEHREGR